MRRQRTISAFLLFAFLIVFAHSVIPHHHDDEDNLSTHQTPGADDHSDVNHNFLSEAFSHLQHEHDGTIIYENATAKQQYSKTGFDEALLAVEYIVKVLYKPPIKYPEPRSIYFTSFLYSTQALLRGPPETLMA